MNEQNLSRVRFQRHLLVFLTVAILFAAFNGLDSVWLTPAALWLVAVVVHGFAAYRLGPFHPQTPEP